MGSCFSDVTKKMTFRNEDREKKIENWTVPKYARSALFSKVHTPSKKMYSLALVFTSQQSCSFCCLIRVSLQTAKISSTFEFDSIFGEKKASRWLYWHQHLILLASRTQDSVLADFKCVQIYYTLSNTRETGSFFPKIYSATFWWERFVDHMLRFQKDPSTVFSALDMDQVVEIFR